ncbi:SPOR domain-containing protein [Roseovarius sp. D0-M9]|uniref:SPOR domain-containing protein n=1 Tax=Roseovarius sp. D0-M9 TaxID=3127117 RepID=UPI00300FCEC8
MADHHAPEAPRGHASEQASSAYSDAQTAPRWEETRPASPLSRVTYALGSLVSVGLVIGLGVWGYQLLVRDVSGVPVVRAATGPMRVQPEDPGGRQAQNQGLSVNAIAAVGSAGAAPDELILAPAALDLSEDDAPTQQAQKAPPKPAPETTAPEDAPENTDDDAPETAGATAPETTQTAEAPAPESNGNDTMLALAEAISAGIKPLEPLDDDTAPAEGTTAQESVQEASSTANASLRPKARPAGLSNIRQTAATAPDAGARDVDPDSIAVGTRLAQLGAFSSEEIAREEWSKLGARFEEYLAGKDRVIQRATSGGRTFYRLRALGFEDLADARRFCSALVAEKAECIPVVTR